MVVSQVDTFVSMLSAASQRLCLPQDNTQRRSTALDTVPSSTSEASGFTGRSADKHPMRRFSRRSLGGLQNKCEQYEVSERKRERECVCVRVCVCVYERERGRCPADTGYSM